MNLLDTRAAGYAAGVAVLAVAVYFVAKRFGVSLGNAVNPASDQNLAYRGTNAVGAALTGDASWSLGSWLYDRFNPPYDPNAVYEPRQTSVRKVAIVADFISEGE